MKHCFAKLLILLIVGGVQPEIILINEFAKLVSHDKNFVKIDYFKFYKKSRTEAALNVSYTTLVDIVSDKQTKAQLAALQFKGTEYKRTVIDFSIGICTLYRTNKFDALSIIKNSNLTGCPFPKGGYYITDVLISSNMLPPFWPEGKWLMDVSLTYLEHVVARVHWMFSVSKKL